jgi:hypothetical protein
LAVHTYQIRVISPFHFKWVTSTGVLRAQAGHGRTELLKHAPHDMLRIWPVSRRVNSPGNEGDAKLIEEIYRLWKKRG